MPWKTVISSTHFCAEIGNHFTTYDQLMTNEFHELNTISIFVLCLFQTVIQCLPHYFSFAPLFIQGVYGYSFKTFQQNWTSFLFDNQIIILANSIVQLSQSKRGFFFLLFFWCSFFLNAVTFGRFYAHSIKQARWFLYIEMNKMFHDNLLTFAHPTFLSFWNL